jgi:ferredoxin/flavodoxin
MEAKAGTAALIIYISPHGTTRKAVEALAGSLVENGIQTVSRSLNDLKNDQEQVRTLIPSYALIVIAAPTYFHHAPPVFMDFVNNMPEAADGQAAAILNTFGGVSSGVVQYDLAKILFKKKYRLLGGVQVLTEHCLTFQHAAPFHGGRPDETDLTVIRQFGKVLAVRLADAGSQDYPPEAFKDKPPVLNFIDNYFNSLRAFAWAMPGVKINRDTCTGCGLCLRNCPVGNITLEQVAVHGKNCSYCYSCVRHCPSGAATAFLGPTAAVPKYLAGIFGRYESQTTRQVV